MNNRTSKSNTQIKAIDCEKEEQLALHSQKSHCPS